MSRTPPATSIALTGLGRRQARGAARALARGVPVLLPGIRINTSPTDFHPIQAVRLAKVDGEKGSLLGEGDEASGNSAAARLCRRESQ